MSLIARLFNFQAGQPAVADDVDAEFNQLLNAINGTSTDKNLVTRYSHASDPPYAFDQLGAGLIAVWRQGGADKAKVNNSGQIETVHQFKSTLATGTKPLDVASTTLVTNLNADLLDGKHAAEWKTLWAAAFYIPNVAARGIDANFNNIQGALIPGSSFVATHVFVKATAGANTGAFIITLRKQPFGALAPQTDLAGVNWNPGLGSVLGVGQEVAIPADGREILTANDFIYPVVTAVAGADQLSVWCGVRGYQTLA